MATCEEALRNCRMVLCLPCRTGDRLRRLRECGIPAVGLDADPSAVQACREHQLIAFRGTWQCLRAHRHKFDGAWIEPDALDSTSEQLSSALSECLMPGARVLIADTAARRFRLLPPFVCRNEHAEFSEWQKPREASPVGPGLRVGPYADLFVGCKRVVELGAGSGRFLDALRLRSIEAHGIESNPALAAAARTRGHDVQHGGIERLATVRGEVDGIFVGSALETLSDDAIRSVILSAGARLSMHGRVVLRAAAGRIHDLIPLIGDGASWRMVHEGRMPGDPRDAFLLLLTGETAPSTRPASPPPVVTNLGQPIEQPLTSLFDLERFERRDWSQGGEDGLLEALFAHIGTTNEYYVEFGCGDGLQCNTTALRRRGWRGLLMDGEVAPGAPDAVIQQAWITAENIESLLDRHGVPDQPDLLSIDVDGNDYWVWQAIRRRPRVVVAEYNANLAADRALTIPYDPDHHWDGTDYYGASLLALVKLARRKGYTLLYCTQAGVNAIFVRDDLLGGEPPAATAGIYRAPNYWYRGARSLPNLGRSMQSV